MIAIRDSSSCSRCLLVRASRRNRIAFRRVCFAPAIAAASIAAIAARSTADLAGFARTQPSRAESTNGLPRASVSWRHDHLPPSARGCPRDVQAITCGQHYCVGHALVYPQESPRTAAWRPTVRAAAGAARAGSWPAPIDAGPPPVFAQLREPSSGPSASRFSMQSA